MISVTKLRPRISNLLTSKRRRLPPDKRSKKKSRASRPSSPTSLLPLRR